MALIDRIIAARLARPPGDPPRDLFDLLRATRDLETGAAFTLVQLRERAPGLI